MCMCCGILETLALCAGLKVLSVCRKKKCDCPRPHADTNKIELIDLNKKAEAEVCVIRTPSCRKKGEK